jgi:hypothetical protein
MKTMNEKIMRERSEALVIALVGKEMAPDWWNSKNKAFGMETPRIRFLTNPEQVYNYLMDYASR